MAAVAEFGLGLDQQILATLALGVVRRVAVRAGHRRVLMGGAAEVGARLILAVAFQAAVGDGPGVDPFESEDLGFVAAAVDVRRPRTVATFAALMRRPAESVQ